MRPRVVVLRGTSANPWDLGPLEDLQDEFEILVAVSGANEFPLGSLELPTTAVRTLSAVVPGSRLQRAATKLAGERYFGLKSALEGASVVHTVELGNWYSAQAARLKQELGFRLATTCWETLPLVDSYRNLRTRSYRSATLEATDRFLATTERARCALALEGAPLEKIGVCPPGIDVDRFAAARQPEIAGQYGHLIVSVGRLVWEKGHQDILRAMSLLRSRGRGDIELAIVGVGPEERTLRSLAEDLGLKGSVSFKGWIPYGEIAPIYRRSSCLVLASLATRHWEEQFGMVLPEAMAADVPVIAAASGAIPEVVGSSGTLFSPGDWVGLADVLEQGPLSGAPVARRTPLPGDLERFSRRAAAKRLREIYRALTN